FRELPLAQAEDEHRVPPRRARAIDLADEHLVHARGREREIELLQARLQDFDEIRQRHAGIAEEIDQLIEQVYQFRPYLLVLAGLLQIVLRLRLRDPLGER